MKLTQVELEQIKGIVKDAVTEKQLDLDLQILEHLSFAKPTGVLTEAGIACLTFMKENEDSHLNSFTSNTIGVGLFKSSRAVSGSLTKLAKDGYLDRDRPDENASYKYSLTDKGRQAI